MNGSNIRRGRLMTVAVWVILGSFLAACTSPTGPRFPRDQPPEEEGDPNSEPDKQGFLLELGSRSVLV